jgi:hypothetical protein
MKYILLVLLISSYSTYTNSITYNQDKDAVVKKVISIADTREYVRDKFDCTQYAWELHAWLKSNNYYAEKVIIKDHIYNRVHYNNETLYYDATYYDSKRENCYLGSNVPFGIIIAIHN